jgi:hypothetical protein
MDGREVRGGVQWWGQVVWKLGSSRVGGRCCIARCMCQGNAATPGGDKSIWAAGDGQVGGGCCRHTYIHIQPHMHRSGQIDRNMI